MRMLDTREGRRQRDGIQMLWNYVNALGRTSMKVKEIDTSYVTLGEALKSYSEGGGVVNVIVNA